MLKLKVSWLVCFPAEVFKIQCSSIVVTSTINYKQSWKSSNCKIQQRHLLLLWSCRALLGSTPVVGNLFYLSYPFHLLFLCWATFHYSFMQPKFLLEKDKQPNHNSKVLFPWPFVIIFKCSWYMNTTYILSSDKTLSLNHQDVEKHHLRRRI